MNASDLEKLALHEAGRERRYCLRISICMGSPCMAAGAAAVKTAIEELIDRHGAAADIRVVGTGCVGPCSRGPILLVVTRDGTEYRYERVTPPAAAALVDRFLNGDVAPTERLLPADLPFFTGQTRLVLANCGYTDPERIEDYIARGGYQSLSRAIHHLSPEAVCEEVTRSGLRGRGGAGYPTGVKWELVRKASGSRKYVVANGDEGDPGAYMDRTIMEADPHRVLEGMALAGFAVGAEQGYIYVRGEYPLAAARLRQAIQTAERLQLLGGRILESRVNFRIDLRMGAGAFVCGEETALLASVMGRRGHPVTRPPYPAQRGLRGCPTLINNVETFATIPTIIRYGWEEFASVGGPGNSGTKVFAICGDLVNAGLVEVPLGTTLRQIVEEIGGGVTGGAFKAAQTGGPSGGCIPAGHLDTPMDYEQLKALGSIMGSGGLIVMNDQRCMVDVARFFIGFCQDESCGKCVPCRAGTVQMGLLLDRICSGLASACDLEQLEELCHLLQETSLCGLGSAAPNPVLSTLRHFRDEYEAHVMDHCCPAAVCNMAATEAACQP